MVARKHCSTKKIDNICCHLQSITPERKRYISCLSIIQENSRPKIYYRGSSRYADSLYATSNISA